jgi:hypothetical protein
LCHTYCSEAPGELGAKCQTSREDGQTSLLCSSVRFGSVLSLVHRSRGRRGFIGATCTRAEHSFAMCKCASTGQKTLERLMGTGAANPRQAGHTQVVRNAVHVRTRLAGKWEQSWRSSGFSWLKGHCCSDAFLQHCIHY